MNSDLNLRRRLRLTLLLPCLPLLAFAAQQQSSQHPAASIETGKRVFAGSCSNSYCHGNEGVGGGGPKLRGRDYSAAYLLKVITEGIPGTAMPGFKNSLSKAQIADVAAYVLSFSTNSAQAKNNPLLDAHAGAPATEEVKPTVAAATAPRPVVTLSDAADLRGDARAGEALFFDAAESQSCRACHSVRGRGGKLGPDLSPLTARAPRELLLAIVAPQAAVDDRYAALTVTTKDGETITGVKRDEDERTLRLYDTSSFPPVSRAFLKAEIAKTEKVKSSPMPHNFAAKYTLQQLLDLISFLKTTEAGTPASVALKELF